MKHRFPLIIGLVILVSLVVVMPVLAGGWATITLDELPGQVMAGEPYTVSFVVRQHGVSPMDGLTPSITCSNSQTGRSISTQATSTGQPGRYSTSLVFPVSGEWKWSIEAFSMKQRMPDLTVTAAVPEAKASPGIPAFGGMLAGALGLVGAIVGLALLALKRAQWALALIVVGLLVSGAGFISASSARSAGPEAASFQPLNQVETGRALFVAKGCVTCHINRNIDRKYVDFTLEDYAPDLTDIKRSPEYLHIWLKDPRAVKPETQMPNLELKKDEIEALIAFLDSDLP